MYNRIAFLNDFLRYDFESYNDEEKAIFSNMDLDGLDTFYIDFDKLPNSLQEESKEATDATDLSDVNIMVIHKDLYSTAFWSIESRNLEEDPITDLKEALDNEEKDYTDPKNLDDPEVSQEYKDLLNRYIDDYIEGEWSDYTKVPFGDGKGYLLIEGDFKG